VGVNSDAGLTGSVILNERNFDVSRPPTGFGDLFRGNGFRGAGPELRAEPVPGTQMQRYTNDGIRELLNQSGHSGPIGQQGEGGVWYNDQPSHLPPERVQGGIQ
jgi:hypothetical protein